MPDPSDILVGQYQRDPYNFNYPPPLYSIGPLKALLTVAGQAILDFLAAIVSFKPELTVQKADGVYLDAHGALYGVIRQVGDARLAPPGSPTLTPSMTGGTLPSLSATVGAGTPGVAYNYRITAIDSGGRPYSFGGETEGGPAGVPTTLALIAPAPILSAGGAGGPGARTEYYTITLLNATGESLPGPEVSIVLTAGQVVTVTSPPPQLNAISYRVYSGLAPSTESLQAASIPIGTNWTEPNTGHIAGAAGPSVNTATTLTGSIGLTWPASLNAVSYNVYGRIQTVNVAALSDTLAPPYWTHVGGALGNGGPGFAVDFEINNAASLAGAYMVYQPFAIVAGAQYVMSVWIDPSQCYGAPPIIYIYDTAHSAAHITVIPPGNPAGRYSVSWTAPPGVTTMSVLFVANATNVAPGKLLRFSQPMIEVQTLYPSPVYVPSGQVSQTQYRYLASTIVPSWTDTGAATPGAPLPLSNLTRESDIAYRARILAALLYPVGTISAIQIALQNYYTQKYPAGFVPVVDVYDMQSNPTQATLDGLINNEFVVHVTFQYSQAFVWWMDTRNLDWDANLSPAFGTQFIDIESAAEAVVERTKAGGNKPIYKVTTVVS